MLLLNELVLALAAGRELVLRMQTGSVFTTSQSFTQVAQSFRHVLVG